MTGLSPRQAALLRFIQGYQEAHGGVSPSCDEIARIFGCKGRNGALHATMKELECGGYISRLRRRARAIEVLAPISIPRTPEGEPLYAVSLVGG